MMFRGTVLLIIAIILLVIGWGLSSNNETAVQTLVQTPTPTSQKPISDDEHDLAQQLTPNTSLIPALTTIQPTSTANNTPLDGANPTPNLAVLATPVLVPPTFQPTPIGVRLGEPTRIRSSEVAPPKLLRFPAVGIEADFEYVGLTPEGAMGVPNHPDRVAWFQLGPMPGQPGNAVIAGHVDWAGKVRAFWWLNRLEPGDIVEIVDENGRSYSFSIQWKRLFDAANAPVRDIFASSNTPEITLITCGGAFDHQTKQYLSRLVVRAALK